MRRICLAVLFTTCGLLDHVVARCCHSPRSLILCWGWRWYPCLHSSGLESRSCSSQPPRHQGEPFLIAVVLTVNPSSATATRSWRFHQLRMAASGSHHRTACTFGKPANLGSCGCIGALARLLSDLTLHAPKAQSLFLKLVGLCVAALTVCFVHVL